MVVCVSILCIARRHNKTNPLTPIKLTWPSVNNFTLYTERSHLICQFNVIHTLPSILTYCKNLEEGNIRILFVPLATLVGRRKYPEYLAAVACWRRDHLRLRRRLINGLAELFLVFSYGYLRWLNRSSRSNLTKHSGKLRYESYGCHL